MDVVKQQILERAAVLSLTGAPRTQIAQELGLSDKAAKRLMDSDEFKQVVQTMGDALSVEAKSKLKKGLARLVDKSLRVLEDNLDEGELEAVKLVFRGLGLEQTDGKIQDTQINVILPNLQPEENVIEVKPNE